MFAQDEAALDGVVRNSQICSYLNLPVRNGGSLLYTFARQYVCQYRVHYPHAKRMSTIEQVSAHKKFVM